MKYDLFISDFDGTLGHAPDVIDAETLKAINEYVEKGGIFAVCSGRMYPSISRICKKYGLKGAVCSYQGARINDAETGEVLFEGGMDANISAEIAEYFTSKGIPYVVELDDVLYSFGKSELIGVYERSCQMVAHPLADPPKVIRERGKKVFKLIGFTGTERTAEVTEDATRRFGNRGILVNNGERFIVETVSADCGKKFAVEFLAKHYGVPINKVLAVGDSTNDIQLLSGDWHTVAVGDAREELKAIADEITVPFKDRPVKYLLEKYCL